MPDRKKSSFGAPDREIPGKLGYRLDEQVKRNSWACSSKSVSASLRGNFKLNSSENRRVKSGSSTSYVSGKPNKSPNYERPTAMKDKRDYTLTGSKMITNSGVNIGETSNRLKIGPGKKTKGKVQSREDIIRRKGTEHVNNGKHRVDDTKTSNDESDPTGQYWKQDSSLNPSSKNDHLKKDLDLTPNLPGEKRPQSPIPGKTLVSSPVQINTSISKRQFTNLPTQSPQSTEDSELMNSPVLQSPSRGSPDSADKERIISPITFRSDGITRSDTSFSLFSTKSSSNITINTDTPISAWSDYIVPNSQEMRERLLKGRFGAQFENYYPYISRKKLLYFPTPTDEDDYDTDLEDGGFDLVSVERARQRKADSPFPDYKSLCRKTGCVPNSRFLRHALDDNLDMRFRYPGINDTKALATEIKNDATVSKLDLSENGLGPSQLISLAEMLHNNTTITDINLSENNTGHAGARILRCVLRSESRLYSLNLGGNQLGDKGARYIASGLERNVFLKELNLSHNEIGELGMKYFCPFLAGNVTLDVLDLSWNHIRNKGAVMLAKAIMVNQQLRVLRVSMNGFHVDGTRAMGPALEENSTLLELDVSANRIPRSGARALAAGLAYNTELRCLKVGFNPLTPEGAEAILDAVQSRDATEEMVVDLEGVYVSQDFESQAADVMEDNKVKIHFSLEPSRRGRSRDHLPGYIHALQLLLRGLNIDIAGIFPDDAEENIIVSGNDVIQRLMRSKRVRDKMVQAELNHFIYSYGNRKFQIRDWMVPAQTGQPNVHDEMKQSC